MKVIVVLLLIFYSGVIGYTLCRIAVHNAWIEVEREFRCVFDEVEERGSKNSTGVALVQKTIRYSENVVDRHMTHPFGRNKK